MIPYYQWIPFILLFQVSSSSTVLVSYLSKDFTDHCKDPGGASGPLSAEFDIFLLGRGRKYRGSAGRTSPVGSKGKTPVGGLGDKVLKWGTKSPRNWSILAWAQQYFVYNWQLYCWNECYIFYRIWSHKGTDFEDISVKLITASLMVRGVTMAPADPAMQARGSAYCFVQGEGKIWNYATAYAPFLVVNRAFFFDLMLYVEVISKQANSTTRK